MLLFGGALPQDAPRQDAVRLLRRLRAAIVALPALGAELMTFSALRALGASLLASAGIAGVVMELAAQSTLSHVLAGLQLTFTDTLRLDDGIVVEGEWGTSRRSGSSTWCSTCGAGAG